MRIKLVWSTMVFATVLSIIPRAGACEKDMDCTEDRVCVNGHCVSTDSTAPNHAPAPPGDSAPPEPPPVGVVPSVPNPEVKQQTFNARFVSRDPEDRYNVIDETSGESCDTPCSLALTPGSHSILVREFGEALRVDYKGVRSGDRGAFKEGGAESLRADTGDAFRQTIVVKRDDQTFEVGVADGVTLPILATVGGGIIFLAGAGASDSDEEGGGDGLAVLGAAIAGLGLYFWVTAHGDDIKEISGSPPASALGMTPVPGGAVAVGSWRF